MRPLIIANWKMNPSNSREAFDLASTVVKGLQGLEVDVVLCPPFLYIPQLLPSPHVYIGAQDCFWENEGPYTGEIAPVMLRHLGCTYVILGHSERRQVGETLEMVHKKVKAALVAGLIPVVCIGEEFEKEMKIVLRDLEIKNLVLVYEPEWAISTQHVPLRGISRRETRPATPQEAQVGLQKMRVLLPKTTTLLYGGSVNSQDIKGFIEAGAAGALVGAASLNAQEFIQLAKNAISR